jgi:hypothetical protein
VAAGPNVSNRCSSSTNKPMGRGDRAMAGVAVIETRRLLRGGSWSWSTPLWRGS